MGRILNVTVASLAILELAGWAMAAQPTARVRGTIDSINGDTLAIQPYSGGTTDLMLDAGTKFAAVVPSNLSDIKHGDFVGIGATGPEDHLVALEVVIFPESMRGAGEGHYSWSLPTAVANADTHGRSATTNGAPNVLGTMTNGTVANTAPATQAPSVQGTMTNGTVATSADQPSGRTLTITFNSGKKAQILVPANAPVVRFVPAERSILAPGEKAFVVGSKPGNSSALSANFVAVGKNGLMPPM